MTKKELCEMCEEYSTEVKCGHMNECKLQKILSENEALKAENNRLRNENDEMKAKRSWDMFPEAMGK